MIQIFVLCFFHFFFFWNLILSLIWQILFLDVSVWQILFLGGKFDKGEEDNNENDKSVRTHKKPEAQSTFLQMIESPGILAGKLYHILWLNYGLQIYMIYCDLFSEQPVYMDYRSGNKFCIDIPELVIPIMIFLIKDFC